VTEEHSKDELLKLVEIEKVLASRKGSDLLGDIDPNERQRDFINSHSKECMFTGANQAGKSTALMMKFTYHMTGLYPSWYKGVRFDRPINAALGGETAQSTRDLLVNRLLGPPESRGSGYFPKGTFVDSDITKMSGGVANQIDYFRVKHHDGLGRVDGYSKAYVFSYSTGWRRLQGYSLDLVAIDEEPELLVYEELSARTNATGGHVDVALTPLMGETELYLMFEDPDQDIKELINYDITCATHMDEAQRRYLLKKYENNPLAEARLYGRPVASTGLVYNIPQHLLMIEDFPVPASASCIIGIDLAHTTGKWSAVKMATERQAGITYVIQDFKAEDITVADFASRLLGMGAGVIPVAWPHDAMRNTSSGTVVAQLRDLGVNVLPEAAHMVDKMTGTKSKAIMTIIEIALDMMAQGMLLFMTRGAQELLSEMRRYRHKNGKIAPRQEDHCIDAMHKALMMLHLGRPIGDSGKARRFRVREEDFFGGSA
jgi:phage terminase large subunit-like protein